MKKLIKLSILWSLVSVGMASALFICNLILGVNISSNYYGMLAIALSIGFTVCFYLEYVFKKKDYKKQKQIALEMKRYRMSRKRQMSRRTTTQPKRVAKRKVS